MALLVSVPARADEEARDSHGALVSGSVATSLPNNGDPGNIRKWLHEHGFDYSLYLTSDALADVAGGIRKGPVVEGKLEIDLYLDLNKAFGLPGLTFFMNLFETHSTGGIRRDYVGSFNTISNVDSLATFRLSEIWFEQKLANDTFSVRFGQLTTDDAEFMVSDYSQWFTTSGWPSITAQNLPSGGPADPFAALGVRVKFDPVPWFSFLVALYDGDPAGPGPDDPQSRNRYGINFRTSDPPLLFAEAQYRYNQGKTDTGLAGVWRVGFWHHFGEFNNQRFDTNGLSLANPLSNGIPAKLSGTTGFYGVLDHQLYRPPGGDKDSGLTVFLRGAASAPDRNQIEFYLDGGVTYTGLLQARPADKIGATFTYSQMSRALAALDQDTIVYTGMPRPIRDYELNVALAYQAQIVPGWTIQPAIHYVRHPGGHVPDPLSPTGAAIPDAWVLMLRSVITY